MTQHIYKFGSPELDALHEAAWEDGRPIRTLIGWRFTSNGLDAQYVYSRERIIKQEYDGFQYIVDHGHFRTLNTMRAGQHAVHMEEI